MANGGSILTLTYLGGERVIPGYNVMGLCKAALECSVSYLAHELGQKKIRVNALSAGPIKTLSGSAVKDFDKMLAMYDALSPMRRNVSLEEVGKSAVYLLSDMSTGVTGETLACRQWLPHYGGSSGGRVAKCLMMCLFRRTDFQSVVKGATYVVSPFQGFDFM